MTSQLDLLFGKIIISSIMISVFIRCQDFPMLSTQFYLRLLSTVSLMYNVMVIVVIFVDKAL
jgi:hypothetical protein